jgi:mRNA-degrading endonuclease toxin of MazEF toxin-antitoxin module
VTGIPFGAIVLTDFPFTDLAAAKRRPALVISTGNDRRTDVVVAYITSDPSYRSRCHGNSGNGWNRAQKEFTGAFR